MKFCPECGQRLSEKLIGDRPRMVCTCGFVDWGNSVNIGAIMVASGPLTAALVGEILRDPAMQPR